MSSRELSCFLCREMLYEFAIHALDERRASSVKKHVSTCRDCLQILQDHERATKHLEELASSKISLKAVQDLKEKHRLISHNVGWRRLPESLRWGLEALVAALVVAASFHFGSQWWANRKVQKADDVVLAEVETLPGEAGQSQNFPEDTLAEADIEADEESGGAPEVTEPTQHSDEVGNESVAGPGLHHAGTDVVETENVQVAEAPPQPEYVVPQTPLVLALNPPTSPQPVAVKPSPSPAQQVPTPATMVMNSAPPPSPAAQEGGFVYRMAMSVKGIDAVTPKVIEKIMELGGQKAGQVQLGWKKPGGSYFHFTMPEAGFTPLMTHLRSFAQVRHSKDPHKRVMPAGTIRIILWVEELEPPKPSVQPITEPDVQQGEVMPPETEVPNATEEAPQTTEENE